jgi:Tfp pilus assembly protein PilP
MTERHRRWIGFRPMLRGSLLLLLVLAGCSKGPEADLQYIKQARSAAAEWALVNEQAAEGKVTPTYASSMHKWLRQEVQTASSALTVPDAPYAAEISALLEQPDDASPDSLRARSDALKTIEDQLESA